MECASQLIVNYALDTSLAAARSEVVLVSESSDSDEQIKDGH